MTKMMNQKKEQFLNTQAFILNIHNDDSIDKGQTFINSILSFGFSPDWDLREQERAVMRLAIKRVLRTLKYPHEQFEFLCADMIQEVIGIYRHALHN